MRPFDFVILFFSFIYALALTHLLLAATNMIRYRRRIAFSPAHAVWMFDALLLLTGNWVSLWDVHTAVAISIWAVAAGFALSVSQYLVCALISPEFEHDDDLDLRAFHDRQSRTYIGAFATLIVISAAINLGAGYGLGLQKWAGENAIVVAMLPATIVPLFVRGQVVQITGAIMLAVLIVAYTLTYYPVLQ